MKRILLTPIFLTMASAQAITEQTFVEQLKKTHPFFNQQALSSQIKLIEKQATTANEDWTIALDAQYKDEDVSHVSSITAYDQLDTSSLTSSATRKFTQTGGDITLKHTWKDKSEDLNTSRNTFSVDYTHPLLKNKDGINDRLNTDVAQLSINKNALDRLEQEEAFILKNLQRFIDLAYAQEQQNINENRLLLAQQELDLVNKRYAASVVEKVDVLLQEDAYQRAKQQLLQAQQDLTLLRREIAITLALDFDNVIAKTDLYKAYKFDTTSLKNHLQSQSRVLKLLELDQQILRRQLKSYQNQSKAKLDLKLGLSRDGEKDNFSDSLERQSTSWNVGLGLSYPLGGVKNNSDISKAKIELEKSREAQQEKLLDLHVQAATLKEKIQLLEAMMLSNREQIVIAKARTVEEKRRYANGNGQASFVINAQNNEQSVALSYAQVAKNYQKSVLEFKATIDQLLR